MTVLVHMAVGAAAGSFVGGRGAAFAVGLLSHIPLDVIPHYEFDKMWIEASIVAAVFAAMLALGLGGTTVFWGALGAAVPDIENLLWRRRIIPGRWKVFPGHSERLSKYVPHGRELPLRHAWWQAAIAVAAALVAAGNLSA